MIKNVLKRSLSILITILMLAAIMPSLSIPAWAATDLNTGIEGLYASYNGGTWSVSGDTITGSVSSTSSGDGCNPSYTTATTTITFKNTSSEEKILSFTYVETNGGGFEFSGTCNPGTKPSTGSTVHYQMGVNQTLIIKITSHSSSTEPTKATLSNVSYLGPQDITTTFLAPAHGTYNVDGIGITTNTPLTKKSDQSYSVSATAEDGYAFVGWFSNNKKISNRSVTTLKFAINSNVEARFSEDPLPKIVVLNSANSSLTKYDVAEYNSFYEPSDYKTAGATNYGTPAIAKAFSSYHGKNGTADNSWDNVSIDNLAWNTQQENTSIKASLSGTAYGDGASSIGNTAGSAKTCANILRIHAKQTINISFDYTVNHSYDTANANTKYDNAFFYSLVTSNEYPSLTDLKSSTSTMWGGNEDSNTGENSYSGHFSETIESGQYLFLYFFGYGYCYRGGANGTSFKYSFSSSVSNLVITTISDSYDFQSGCITGAGDMIGNGVVSVNGIEYPVGSNGLTTALTDVNDGQSMSLAVTTVPSGYVHIGWRVIENGNTTDIHTETYIHTMRSDVSVYALFSPKITVTAGSSGFADASYSYKTPNNTTQTGGNQYIARSSDGSKWYKTLSSAFSEQSNVVLVTNVVFEGNFTIDQGKTLSVPYSVSDVGGGDLQREMGTGAICCYITATINGSMTVRGSLVASARQGTPQGQNGKAFGKVGFIEVNGSASIESTGYLYAYGVVTGSGGISVKSGGKVYELLDVRDMRNLYGVIGHASGNTFDSVLPFNCYYINNILASTTYSSGSRLYAMYFVNLNEITSYGSAPIIGPFSSSGSDSSLFMISQGSVTKKYVSSGDEKNRIQIVVNSDSTVESGKFTVSVTAKMVGEQTITIDTSQKVLPLNAGYYVEVADGGSLKLNSDFKILPGGKVMIDEGGTLTIASGKKLVMYRANDYDYRSKGSASGDKQGFTVNGYPQWFSYPTGVSTAFSALGSAKLIVDGTLDCKGGLYTTNQLTGLTNYANGYNYLTGTGMIIVDHTISDGTIKEQIERTNSSSTDTNAAAVQTVDITAIKGITNYDATTDDGQTDYNSLTKATWYGYINDSNINVWSTTQPTVKPNPKASDFNFTAPSNLTYDGNAKAATVSPKSGITGMGAVTVKYFKNGTEVPAANVKDAGTYTVKIDVAEGDSYNAATALTDATWTFTIAKANISPSVTMVGWTYGGTASNPSVTGNPGNGAVTYQYKVSTAADSTYTATKPTNAGTYTVKATVAATGNYNGGSATTNFTIAKANISPSVTMAGWTYGGTASNPSVTGNPGNGAVTYQYKVSTAADSTYTATKPTNAGTYTVRATVAATTNYNGGSATVDFTISPADMTINASGYTGTYDGAAHKITVTAPDGAVVTYSETENGTYTPTNPTYTNAGTYTVYYKVTKANYTTVTGNATVVINARPLTVTANPNTITYGDAPAANGVTYSGFVNNETSAVLSGTLAAEFTYSQYGDVGSYEITPKGLTSSNYAITFVSGTLTVQRKTVGLSWTNLTFTYDGQSHAPTATATGLVNNDVVTVTVSGEQTNVGSTYTATATGLTGDKSGNYALPENNTQTFEITKAGQTAPTGLTVAGETYKGQANGSISGLTEAMEYRRDGETEYIPITGTTLEGLAAGTYYVRYKADANHDASADATVVVGEGRMIVVTWVDGNGNTLKTDEVVYNATPEYTGETPTKAATAQYTYSFTGWNPAITSVTGDATYTATFTAAVRNYTVTFSLNGQDGDAPVSLTVTYGSKIAEPTEPTGDHYIFKGWYKEADCLTPWDFENDTVTGETVLYAKWAAAFELTLDDRTDPTGDQIWFTETDLEDEGLYEPGATFSVTSEMACVVAISYDGGETYEELVVTELTDNGDGTMTATFTLPEELDQDFQIGIILLGDANGDGDVDDADGVRITRWFLGVGEEGDNNTLDALQELAANADRDEFNEIDDADGVRITRWFLGIGEIGDNNTLDWNVRD